MKLGIENNIIFDFTHNVFKFRVKEILLFNIKDPLYFKLKKNFLNLNFCFLFLIHIRTCFLLYELAIAIDVPQEPKPIIPINFNYLFLVYLSPRNL